MPNRQSDRGDATTARSSYVFVLPWELHHAGGVNQVVLNLHREALAAGDLEPLVLVNEWSAFRPGERVVDGRRTLYLRLASPWPDRRPVAGFLKWLATSPVWVADLLGLCRRRRVAAFNVHYPGLSALPLALLRHLRLYRGALILSFHGTDLRTANRTGRVERALWGFLLGSATAIVACSQSLADDILAFSSKASGKVHVIPNGLDLPRFLESADRAVTLPEPLEHREFILSIATWEPQKCLDVLLRAFAGLRRTTPGLALVLVGRPGPAEGALRSLAQELGIENEVFFHANVPHARIGLFLERARVFCLPSRAESFPISILEAGAYRTPVVASRVGGVPEIVVDGESGCLVEPGDVEGLAAALGRVIGDADFGRDLGERLHERVAREFTWRRAYEGYRALLPRS
jgi:glycosyltransferase involved in cell wall biosynthesis